MIKKRIHRWIWPFRSKPSRSRSSRSSSGGKVDIKRYFRLTCWVLLVLGIAWGTYRTQRYAEQTERLELRKISVTGLNRVSENEIFASVGLRSGINVYRLNLEETRKAVEEILWVRHATIKRVWPNELVISIVEREPIALARIDSEIFQVDIEGVALSPDSLTRINAPILTGLDAGDIEGNERKIDIYRDVVDAIGESHLSEVHVTESGEVSVVPIDSPILVDLGLDSHRDRWERYVGLSVQIREDYPDAFRVDLRFQDQVVIQTKENTPSGKIIWGEETKRL